jgi:hypothetical protein
MRSLDAVFFCAPIIFSSYCHWFFCFLNWSEGGALMILNMMFSCVADCGLARLRQGTLLRCDGRSGFIQSTADCRRSFQSSIIPCRYCNHVCIVPVEYIQIAFTSDVVCMLKHLWAVCQRDMPFRPAHILSYTYMYIHDTIHTYTSALESVLVIFDKSTGY